MVSLDNTSGTFASSRLYADPKYAAYGNTYSTKWTEKVDEFGNISRDATFATKDPDGYYMKNNHVETWNGHASDDLAFNVNYKTKYRNEHRRKRR